MRFLASACIIFLAFSVTIFHASANPHSTCIPAVPPALPGSFIPLPAQQSVIFINEVLLAPHAQWACPGTRLFTPLWIELYNPQNEALNLYSAHSNFDSGPATSKFYLPFGSIIAAHGFLVIFPCLSPQCFSSKASTLRLLVQDTIIDQVALPDLATDEAYARIPDGSNNWQITTSPTIDTSNILSTNHTTTKQIRQKSVSKSKKTTPIGLPASKHTTIGSISGSDNPGSASGNTTTPTGQTNGTQPDWQTLQHSTRNANTLSPITAILPQALPQPSSQMNSSADIVNKVIFTLLAIVLALSLLWCWRRFSSP